MWETEINSSQERQARLSEEKKKSYIAKWLYSVHQEVWTLYRSVLPSYCQDCSIYNKHKRNLSFQDKRHKMFKIKYAQLYHILSYVWIIFHRK